MLARETSSPNNPVVMEGQPRPASHELQPPAAGQEQHHSLYNAHLRQLQQLHSPLHPTASPVSTSSAIPLPPPPPQTAVASFGAPPNVDRQLEPFTPSAQFQTSQPPQPAQPTSLFRSEDGAQQRDDFLLMQQEHQQFQFQQQLQQQQQQQQQQKRDVSISRPQRDPALYRPTDQTGQNQLFAQQHGYAQLGQQATDRSPQGQQQSRSLLQPQNPMTGYPPNAQFDGNRFAQHPNNYMLHQSQQMQLPDDFSGGHPRGTNMVNFPTPMSQFNMPRYSAPAPASTIDGFSMNSVNPDVQQSESNQLSRADALYRPLVPSGKLRNTYGKSPTMVGLQDMSNDAQLLLSPRPKTETGGQNLDAAKGDKQGTPSKKEQQQLQSPIDGVPSTVVADAGSATDIDGSLIARLRGFSGVNQGHQKQHMLGPGLPPNLFPGSIEPQSMGQAQGAHPDSYSAGMGGMRVAHPGNRQVGDAGNMLSPQRGMLPGPGQLPIGMTGGAGTASAPEATPERPFRCKFCQASFGRRDNMQKHMRSIHMGERPFVCEICAYAFQKKDHKDKHVRTVHLKERPYQCNLCESRFGQKSDLTKHVRTVHQRIKPFRCEHCGLSFGHRGNKLRHVFVVHQKRKPHVCTICKQAFGERSNLAKHSLAVHKHALK